MQCEVSRSAGYDPTGEWAVECGADGEYCPVCEIVVCAHCHKQLAATHPEHDRLLKKPPATVFSQSRQRQTGS
jgi:hypothetical protein